jgi:large subunit ribosomal protein L17
MRHLNTGRNLSRSTSHRKALLNNLAQELFQHKRIRTTLAKAKELRPFAEKLVTTAKKGDIAARRHVLRFLSRKSVVKSLFDSIAPSFAERNGGYTRIIKLGTRIGDAAPLAIIELVGFEGVIKAAAEEKSKTEKGAKGGKGKVAPKGGKATDDEGKKVKKTKKETAATAHIADKKQKTMPRKVSSKSTGRSKSGSGE